jgi:hypothetical protein
VGGVLPLFSRLEYGLLYHFFEIFGSDIASSRDQGVGMFAGWVRARARLCWEHVIF